MRFFLKFLKNWLLSFGETLHDEINLQQVSFEMMFVWPPIREGTLLKEHLDEINFVPMELRDIDVKREGTLWFFLSVGTDFITLEEVKCYLYSRE